MKKQLLGLFALCCSSATFAMPASFISVYQALVVNEDYLSVLQSYEDSALVSFNIHIDAIDRYVAMDNPSMCPGDLTENQAVHSRSATVMQIVVDTVTYDGVEQQDAYYFVTPEAPADLAACVQKK